MYTFAKTFTVFLAFLHPIKTHSFAALKVAWLDCAEDSVLPPSTGRSPIILSALGKKGKNRVQPSRVGILCVILENQAFNGPRTIDIATIPLQTTKIPTRLLGVSFNRKSAADMPEIHHTPRPLAHNHKPVCSKLEDTQSHSGVR